MEFWPLFVLLVVMFVVMLLVLRQVLSRHYLSATARLQSLSADYSRRQEELKGRIEEAETQYKERMMQVQLESDRILSQARQEAESVRARTLGDARQESERIMQQALESREGVRREIEQAFEARTIERACHLIRSGLPEPLRRELHVRWFEELLHGGFGHAQGASEGEALSEIRVASAFPLTAEQRRVLQERLAKAFGPDVAIAEELDERLVAGVRITAGSRVLDGSLSLRIQQAAHAAHEANGR